MGLSYGHFESNLWLNGFFAQGAAIEEDGTMLALEYRPGGRWTFQVSSGAVIGGAMTTDGVRYQFAPGWMHAASVTTRWVDGRGYAPFVLTSLSVSVSSLATSPEHDAADTQRLLSIDTGLIVTVGKTFFRTVSPYVMARVFGGPIFWHNAGHDVLGTDQYHFQVGGGVVLSLFRRVDLFVEGAPLGERRVSAGAGFSY